MAFNFLKNSGLQETAENTGHTSQKLFDDGNSLFSGIGLIINSVLGLVGVIFMGLMIYGGYLWMTAAGNESQVEKALGIIKSAIIGLLITFAAFTISYFVMTAFVSEGLK